MSSEVPISEQPGLVVEYALAELALGTRSLLNKTEATEQLVFQPGTPYHASVYPDVPDPLSDFVAEKVDEHSWQVNVFASNRLQQPLSTNSLTMSRMSYVIVASNFYVPMTVQSMYRDFYVNTQAAPGYRPRSFKQNLTPRMVLKAIVPAVLNLRMGYDSNPEDWIVK